ncbi:MAG: tripartite tricarboxylate transporter substrate binding protein [Synergistaceae bacterium]|nr:tripartite tricarboxylate transporter substrate binding protein [Synergistaceae bacterium]
MRKFLVLALAAAVLALSLTPAMAAYPEKPVKIVNYVAPGGLMDVTSRKFISIAQKYTDATFVVENTTGAGGLVAIGAVLEQPADGYTVFAATTSVVDKVVSAKKNIDEMVWGFEWVAMLMKDPECVITAEKGEYDTFEKLVAAAKKEDGRQIWGGPATGGNDHIFAQNVWAAAGIKAKWLPYKSGPEAMMGTLAGQNAAYVGNPADTQGRQGYKIVAISSPKRLPQLPDVPTFKELGYKGLDNEFMWRGFAIKKGAPEEAYKWWEELNQKVAKDPEWRSFLVRDGIEVSDWGRDKFSKQVEIDIAAAQRFLKK